MLIIKIGGSVFAPKNNKEFDSVLLKKLFKTLSLVYSGQIILVHGAGNFGHGFVSQYGISPETMGIFEKKKKIFFSNIEKIFIGYNRKKAENVIDDYKSVFIEKKNYIIGGDIHSKTLDVISGDDIFGKIINNNPHAISIMMTDISGVLGNDGNLIARLPLQELNSILFWKKEGDVTNGMEGKLKAIDKYMGEDSTGVWIINGEDNENLREIIKTGKGKGTLLVK